MCSLIRGADNLKKKDPDYPHQLTSMYRWPAVLPEEDQWEKAE